MNRQGLCITRYDENSQSLSYEVTDPAPIPNMWAKPKDENGYMHLTWALARGTDDLAGDTQEHEAIGMVLEAVQLEVKLIFDRVKLSENPDITFQWVDGTTDPVINGDNTITGYGGYPQTQYQGKVVLNDNFNWDWINVNFHMIMHNTLGHEHLHVLGCVHSPADPQSVMYPQYNGIYMMDDTDKRQLKNKYEPRNLDPVEYERILTYIQSRRSKPF